MTLPYLLLGALVVAVLGASARLLWWQRGASTPARGWRLAVLLLAQPLCAALLYFTLLPPTTPGRSGTLVVLTAGARAVPAHPAGDVLLALPEAPVLAGATRVPDLATALRRYPGSERLRIVGTGLEPRDHEAAATRSLQFEPTPAAAGVVRLRVPERIAPGTLFSLGGRVQGGPGGWVELVDPAGQRIDATRVGANGDFLLTGSARGPGLASFQLRFLDRQRQGLETLEVPLWIHADPVPRVLILAGAPNPELKYLRRWMADAGLKAHTQISVGGGMQLGDATLPLTRSTLEGFDLAVVDDRAWAALGGAQRDALGQAVRDGLGLMLRFTGPVPEASRAQLRGLGFRVSGGSDSAEVRLPERARDQATLRARRGSGSEEAPIDTDASSVPLLNRRVLRIEASDAVSWLRDASGASLADWRAEGRGRVGLWSLSDSYRLVLEGRKDVHGELWSEAFATLARAHVQVAPRIDADAWVQQRMRICGVGQQAKVIGPDARQTGLLPDPATGSPPCAGFWPTQPGWHLLKQGEASWPFHVRAQDQAQALRNAGLREATLQLVGERSPTARAATPAPAQRGSSWPWFLAWLLASAALWWFERSRLGRLTGPTTSW